MKANRANSIPSQATGAVETMAMGGVAGRVCPSVCPSDWDKRKTPFVNPSLEGTYEGRPKAKRRGQDSNLRSSLTPLNGLANRRFRPLSHLSKLLTSKALRRFLA